MPFLYVRFQNSCKKKGKKGKAEVLENPRKLYEILGDSILNKTLIFPK